MQSSKERANEGTIQNSNVVPTTRAGRVVHPPSWLVDYETNAVEKYEIKLTDAEDWYYEAVKSNQKEFDLVGAELGGEFTNTNKIHVLKYNQAMKQPDKK
jgi:hypothetical protein